ncbi:MAG: efflux RND transporter periplasmic adaptor subunit [Pseudomonadota bacterium]
MIKLSTKCVIGTLVVLAIVGIAVVSTLTADTSSDQTVPPQAPEAMQVNVTIAKREDTQIWKNFSARLEAVDFVELRPQVSGTIVKVNFEDGQHVNEGDVIFVIDPDPFEADVARAKADLNSAETNYDFAEQQFLRAQNLIKTDAISKSVFDQRKNAYESSKAAILSSKADLKRASIDLDRAYVKAPISGRLGQIEVTKGNLVDGNQNPPILTTIVSEEFIYADFEVDEQTYLQFVRTFAKNKEAEKEVPVRLKLNRDSMIYEGTIYTFDNQLDVSSGTIRARALFENSDNALLPGMFAQVEMGSAASQSKMFIDERAIGTDQDRRFVFIVDQDNTVTYRELKLGTSSRGQREVLSGLDEGDKVIVDGIMFMRPGMKVKPVVISDPLSIFLNQTDALSS